MGDAAKPPARPGRRARERRYRLGWPASIFGQGIAEQRQQRTVDVGQGAAGLFLSSSKRVMARMLIADLKRTFALSNKCVGSAWVSTYRVSYADTCRPGRWGAGTKRGTILLPRGWTYHSA